MIWFYLGKMSTALLPMSPPGKTGAHLGPGGAFKPEKSRLQRPVFKKLIQPGDPQGTGLQEASAKKSRNCSLTRPMGNREEDGDVISDANACELRAEVTLGSLSTRITNCGAALECLGFTQVALKCHLWTDLVKTVWALVNKKGEISGGRFPDMRTGPNGLSLI